MEIREPDRFAGEGFQVGCHDLTVVMTAEITVSETVGDYGDDVRKTAVSSSVVADAFGVTRRREAAVRPALEMKWSFEVIVDWLSRAA